MITPDQVKKEKTLLGITEGGDDSLVQFALESAEETILNYCNISRVPEGLSATMYRMAADIYRNEQFDQQEAAGKVESISEGDTTVSFGSAGSEFTEGLLKDYSMALRKYRKVVF